jgi:hypothetical protein
MDERSETRATAQRIARECVGARIRMLNRKISRIYDEAVRPHGIKFSQMNILTMVALNEPVAPVDLVRVLELEKSTLSRNVALMEATDGSRASPAAAIGSCCARRAKVGGC